MAAPMSSEGMELEGPPSNFRSTIWKHFGFKVSTVNGVKITEKENIICRHCNASIKYKTGTTTNMSTHMRRHHPDVVFFVDMNDCFLKVKSSVSPVVKQNLFGQLRLNEAFKSKLNINSPRALAISKAIGQLIVVDKGNNKITELRTILQRESKNS